MKRLLTAEDIRDGLGVSLSVAYKLIRECNAELQAEGYFTIRGRVPAAYLNKKIYAGGGADDA